MPLDEASFVLAMTSGSWNITFVPPSVRTEFKDSLSDPAPLSTVERTGGDDLDEEEEGT